MRHAPTIESPVATISIAKQRLSSRAQSKFCYVLLLVVALLVIGECSLALAQTKAPPATKPRVAPTEDSQLYRNTTFGFRYLIPYGWVDRAKEMHEENGADKATVLLAVFERPPQATGDSVNCAVVIAAESAASYPGLKRADDYLGPLTELAMANGFKADGDPYPLEVESRQLLRADFVKSLNDKVTMHQSTLILFAKGQIVSFTFIAGSDEELDELMDGLHFSVARSAVR